MNNPRLGIMLMLATMLVFATQDGFSRFLAEKYNVMTVVLFRYWFFAAFVLALSASREGGIRRVAKSNRPGLQIFRGVLLVAEICVMILAFVLLGLVEAHAIFATYPLIVSALSGLVLGEPIGWRRRVAVAAGFVGVLIILRPGFQVFSPDALVALTAAVMFAIYSLATRLVARYDSAETSFFYTGVSGAVAITLIAPFWWDPMQTAADWGWMAALCVFGALGHYLLIRAYEATEVATIQPFAYFQLVFASAIGITFFGDSLQKWTVAGVALIVAAGLFTLWRERVKSV